MGSSLKSSGRRKGRPAQGRDMGIDGSNDLPDCQRHPRHREAPRQHMYASLHMNAEAGTKAHSVVDNTLGKNGLEAWRSLVQRFDPASASANQPPKAKVQHIVPR